ncbi:MAG TPA: threonine/serine dehydratase [Blastocatellia bacterium]|nr:threonine/serine dehydratase [Blastocatellia bacterium]
MNESTQDLTIEDVKNAQRRIASLARRTPLERSRRLSEHDKRDVFLKLECFQLTGSFKLRGAMSKLSALTEEQRARGVLTVSAGNHGLAVAHCCEALGLQATIVVPESASRAKVEAIRRFPVTLIERGADYDSAERAAREMERESGATFVSPYNDPEVIAGQGTIALELFEDKPDLEVIIVPIGGGGLIAGVAIAAKSINPRVKVYGVEPSVSPTMTAALEAGRIIETKEDPTIADGCAGNIEPGSITFPLIQKFVDDVFLVSEESIQNAIVSVAREEHLVIEGSAALSIAALDYAGLESTNVCSIVSGRNISLDTFAELISRHRE